MKIWEMGAFLPECEKCLLKSLCYQALFPPGINPRFPEVGILSCRLAGTFPEVGITLCRLANIILEIGITLCRLVNIILEVGITLCRLASIFPTGKTILCKLENLKQRPEEIANNDANYQI